MALFVAFSDETEVAGPDGEFFLGGYVAREDEWPWVARAWQERVLDGPPRIPYLHMREIRNEGWRNTYGISLQAAECRISEAARIMDSFGNVAANASCMQKSHLKQVFHSRYRKLKHVPTGLDQPDYLCFFAYAVLMLGQVHTKWPEVEKLNFVVSRKQEVTHHVAEFKDEMQKLLSPALRDLVGELIPASMEDRLPLQAADTLLWHIQRYYAAGKDQTRMNPVDRMRAAQLIHNGDMSGTIHQWEKSELEEMAERWVVAGKIPKL